MTEGTFRSVLTAALVALAAFAAGPEGVAESRSEQPDLDRALATRDMEPIHAWLAGLTGPEAGSVEAWRARIALVGLSDTGDTHEQRAAMLDQALEAHPESVELLLARASLNLESIDDAGSFGKLRIARSVRDDLEQALALDPQHVRAIVANIRFHDQAPRIAGGRDRTADALLEQLDSLDAGESAFIRFRRLSSDDRSAAALDQLERAVEQARGSKPAWETILASELYADGQSARALRTAIGVTDRYPFYGPAWYLVGRIGVETGDESGRGEQALEQFLQMPRWPGDPQMERARQMLEALQNPDNG